MNWRRVFSWEIGYKSWFLSIEGRMDKRTSALYQLDSEEGFESLVIPYGGEDIEEGSFGAGNVVTFSKLFRFPASKKNEALRFYRKYFDNAPEVRKAFLTPADEEGGKTHDVPSNTDELGTPMRLK